MPITSQPSRHPTTPITAKKGDKVKILCTAGGPVTIGEVRVVTPIRYGPLDQDGKRAIYSLNEEYYAKFCRIARPYPYMQPSTTAGTTTGTAYAIFDTFHEKFWKVYCDFNCIFPIETADEDCVRLGTPLFQQQQPKYIPGQTVVYSPAPRDEDFYDDRDYAEVMAIYADEVWILYASRFDEITRQHRVAVVVNGDGLLRE
jgi:hypothetical protein